MASSVGVSLTALTVTVNVCEVEASSLFPRVPSRPASVTVTVITELPLASPTGVKFRVPVASGEL